MKNFITFGLILFGVLGSYASQAQNKFGYISADEIIASMPEAARIDTQLNQYQQSLYQNAQEKKCNFSGSSFKVL